MFGWCGGWVTGCRAMCIEFGSWTEQLFVLSTHCFFGSGCDVYVNLYICRRNSSVGQMLLRMEKNEQETPYEQETPVD
uniref:SFRICE_026475 n=1 Tax=Spodoptera frugiperda TaxID=7108 RepID=A0A2H1V8Q3_SPOFR